MGGYLGNQSVVTQINVSPTDVSDKDNASTGALDLPSGTTAQRPANPNTGYTRFNTTLGQQETWNGSAWVTSGGLLMQSVQTANFTAVAGNAYPVNTTAGAVTVTLPASPLAGNQVQIIDYAGTAATNAITINPNGGKINGTASSVAVMTIRASVTLIYVDATQGWVDSSKGDAGYLRAPNSVSYLAVAGGGGGGGSSGDGWLAGGGGAGGYLSGTATLTPGTVYPITIGSGGTAGASYSGATGAGTTAGTNGSNSSFGSIAAPIGGGGGGAASGTGSAGTKTYGLSGGSGGGAGTNYGGVTPPGGSGTSGQGYAGGSGASNGTGHGGSGGGAGGAGTSDAGLATSGGAGVASAITGASVTYASGGACGIGGGGPSNAAANSGNGGASSVCPLNTSVPSANGGSGVVILSVPTANYSGAANGSPTITVSGLNTILTFTSSGSYTA